MPLPPDGSVERPQFILSLDDLPKVVQANGTVYPIYLSLRDVSRMFGLELQTVRKWSKMYDWPCLAVSHVGYVPVQFVVDWIASNTRLFRELDMHPRWSRAKSGSHSELEGSA